MDIREKTRQQAEVMMAFANGKDVEYRDIDGKVWRDILECPQWSWGIYEYRVKKQELKPGGNYKTRDGKDVRIYAIDGGGKQPVHGAVRDEGFGWISKRWMLSGRNNDRDSKIDIIL